MNIAYIRCFDTEHQEPFYPIVKRGRLLISAKSPDTVLNHIREGRKVTLLNMFNEARCYRIGGYRYVILYLSVRRNWFTLPEIYLYDYRKKPAMGTWKSERDLINNLWADRTGDMLWSPPKPEYLELPI